MVNTYLVKDVYFNDIIRDYFNNNPNWIEKKTLPVDLYHANSVIKCNTCKYHNHFSDITAISNKWNLYKNIIDLNGERPYYLPYTKKYTSKDIIYNKNDEIENEIRKYNKWIAKPTNSMRQRGIKIFKSYSVLKDWISNNKKYQEWIIQEYIDNCLLFNKKKFHFRVYGLITSRKKNKYIEGYIYPKGYMMVADKDYNSDEPDKYTSITTSCNNHEFPIKFDKYYGKNLYINKIYPQIQHIFQNVVHSTYHKLKCTNAQCYNLVALDIISDNRLNVHLLECNARIIGMASSDPPGNCLSKQPLLQTPKFKKELMFEILNCVLYKKRDLFDRIIKVNTYKSTIKLYETKYTEVKDEIKKKPCIFDIIRKRKKTVAGCSFLLILIFWLLLVALNHQHVEIQETMVRVI